MHNFKCKLLNNTFYEIKWLKNIFSNSLFLQNIFHIYVILCSTKRGESYFQESDDLEPQ